MPRKVSPDLHLSADNYRAVNRTFYAAAPADYFHRRLLNLVLVAGNRQGLDDLFSQGVTYRGFAVGKRADTSRSDADPAAQASQADSEEEAVKSADHYVTSEAEVLAHHAGETLLRLYLAHEFRGSAKAPACPPLDLARLRSFSEAKARIARRFGEDSDPADRANLDAVARVFHATEIRENLLPKPPPGEAWDESIELIEGYLRAFAHQHLSRAALYNAGKHGLALTPTDIGFQMDDGSLLKVEGPAIQYLEVRDDEAGRPRWEQVTHWVRPDRQIGLIYRTCEMIEALWQTARYRYLGPKETGGYKFHLVSGPTYHDLVFSDAPETGVVIDDMRWQLAYDDDPDAQARQVD